MQKGNLSGCAAIVTGGALGIGGAIARRLSAEGAHTLIVDVNESAANDNAKRIIEDGGSASFMVGDVSQTQVAKGMVERAVSEWGRLDILVQNAYAGAFITDGTALNVTEEAFDSGIGLLVRALYIGAKFAVPAMIASGPVPCWKPTPWEGAGLRHGKRPPENVGRIVNISSVHGVLQSPKKLGLRNR